MKEVFSILGWKHLLKSHTSPCLHPENLRAEIPEILQATGYIDDQSILKYGDQFFSESVHFVQEDFLQMFSFPLLSGNPSTALDQPGKVVLTQEIAQKLFNDAPALGKTIEMEIFGTYQPFMVSGVIR